MDWSNLGLLVLFGVVFLMMRRGGGCCGGGHNHTNSPHVKTEGDLTIASFNEDKSPDIIRWRRLPES